MARITTRTKVLLYTYLSSFFFVTYFIQPTQCLFGRVEIGCFYSLYVPILLGTNQFKKRITIITDDEEKERKNDDDDYSLEQFF